MDPDTSGDNLTPYDKLFLKSRAEGRTVMTSPHKFDMPDSGASSDRPATIFQRGAWDQMNELPAPLQGTRPFAGISTPASKKKAKSFDSGTIGPVRHHGPAGSYTVGSKPTMKRNSRYTYYPGTPGLNGPYGQIKPDGSQYITKALLPRGSTRKPVFKTPSKQMNFFSKDKPAPETEPRHNGTNLNDRFAAMKKQSEKEKVEAPKNTQKVEVKHSIPSAALPIGPKSVIRAPKASTKRQSIGSSAKISMPPVQVEKVSSSQPEPKASGLFSKISSLSKIWSSSSTNTAQAKGTPFKTPSKSKLSSPAQQDFSASRSSVSKLRSPAEITKSVKRGDAKIDALQSDRKSVKERARAVLAENRRTSLDAKKVMRKHDIIQRKEEEERIRREEFFEEQNSFHMMEDGDEELEDTIEDQMDDDEDICSEGNSEQDVLEGLSSPTTSRMDTTTTVTAETTLTYSQIPNKINLDSNLGPYEFHAPPRPAYPQNVNPISLNSDEEEPTDVDVNDNDEMEDTEVDSEESDYEEDYEDEEKKEEFARSQPQALAPVVELLSSDEEKAEHDEGSDDAESDIADEEDDEDVSGSEYTDEEEDENVLAADAQAKVEIIDSSDEEDSNDTIKPVDNKPLVAEPVAVQQMEDEVEENTIVTDVEMKGNADSTSEPDFEDELKPNGSSASAFNFGFVPPVTFVPPPINAEKPNVPAFASKPVYGFTPPGSMVEPELPAQEPLKPSVTSTSLTSAPPIDFTPPSTDPANDAVKATQIELDSETSVDSDFDDEGFAPKKSFAPFVPPTVNAGKPTIPAFSVAPVYGFKPPASMVAKAESPADTEKSVAALAENPIFEFQPPVALATKVDAKPATTHSIKYSDCDSETSESEAEDEKSFGQKTFTPFIPPTAGAAKPAIAPFSSAPVYGFKPPASMSVNKPATNKVDEEPVAATAKSEESGSSESESESESEDEASKKTFVPFVPPVAGAAKPQVPAFAAKPVYGFQPPASMMKPVEKPAEEPKLATATVESDSSDSESESEDEASKKTFAPFVPPVFGAPKVEVPSFTAPPVFSFKPPASMMTAAQMTVEKPVEKSAPAPAAVDNSDPSESDSETKDEGNKKTFAPFVPPVLGASKAEVPSFTAPTVFSFKPPAVLAVPKQAAPVEDSDSSDSESEMEDVPSGNTFAPFVPPTDGAPKPTIPPLAAAPVFGFKPPVSMMTAEKTAEKPTPAPAAVDESDSSESESESEDEASKKAFAPFVPPVLGASKFEVPSFTAPTVFSFKPPASMQAAVAELEAKKEELKYEVEEDIESGDAVEKLKQEAANYKDHAETETAVEPKDIVVDEEQTVPADIDDAEKTEEDTTIDLDSDDEAEVSYPNLDPNPIEFQLQQEIAQSMREYDATTPKRAKVDADMDYHHTPSAIQPPLVLDSEDDDGTTTEHDATPPGSFLANLVRTPVKAFTGLTNIWGSGRRSNSLVKPQPPQSSISERDRSLADTVVVEDIDSDDESEEEEESDKESDHHDVEMTEEDQSEEEGGTADQHTAEVEEPETEISSSEREEPEVISVNSTPGPESEKPEIAEQASDTETVKDTEVAIEAPVSKKEEIVEPEVESPIAEMEDAVQTDLIAEEIVTITEMVEVTQTKIVEQQVTEQQEEVQVAKSPARMPVKEQLVREIEEASPINDSSSRQTSVDTVESEAAETFQHAQAIYNDVRHLQESAAKTRQEIEQQYTPKRKITKTEDAEETELPPKKPHLKEVGDTVMDKSSKSKTPAPKKWGPLAPAKMVVHEPHTPANPIQLNVQSPTPVQKLPTPPLPVQQDPAPQLEGPTLRRSERQLSNEPSFKPLVDVPKTARKAKQPSAEPEKKAAPKTPSKTKASGIEHEKEAPKTARKAKQPSAEPKKEAPKTTQKTKEAEKEAPKTAKKAKEPPKTTSKRAREPSRRLGSFEPEIVPKELQETFMIKPKETVKPPHEDPVPQVSDGPVGRRTRQNSKEPSVEPEKKEIAKPKPAKKVKEPVIHLSPVKEVPTPKPEGRTLRTRAARQASEAPSVDLDKEPEGRNLRVRTTRQGSEAPSIDFDKEPEGRNLRARTTRQGSEAPSVDLEKEAPEKTMTTKARGRAATTAKKAEAAVAPKAAAVAAPKATGGRGKRKAEEPVEEAPKAKRTTRAASKEPTAPAAAAKVTRSTRARK